MLLSLAWREFDSEAASRGEMRLAVVFRDRQVNVESSESAWFRFNAEPPSVLTNNAVADRKPKPGSFIAGLRGEEWIKDTIDNVIRDPDSPVLHRRA